MCVSDEYGIDVNALKKKYDKGRLNEIKAAFVFVCCSLLQLKTKDMRRVLGGLSRSAIANLYNKGSLNYENKRGCYQDIQKIINISKTIQLET